MSEDQTQKPKILIPEVKLQSRIAELGAEISADYKGKEVVCICILKGSFIFFSDLIREFTFPMTCEFLAVSSYGNKKVSSGEVKLTLDINEPLEGKHVILIEDIIDSGLTINYIRNMLVGRQPASIKICALLYKEESIQVPVQCEYIGFKIGREFVIGYGMDYAGKYRGLPYIGHLEHEH